jgi:PhnB protein
MQLISYLTFNGQCEEAFRFYEQALGGHIETMMPHAGSPMENHAPPEWRDKIMHARLTVGGATLMGSDAPPGRYEAPKGSWVHIGLEDAAEADRIFQVLSEGGSVHMPIQKTFWASRFGMLVDRFGTPWMVNCA